MLKRTRIFATWLAVVIVVLLLIDCLTFNIASARSVAGTVSNLQSQSDKTMFETVHTMTDWYDGPRHGVAIVNNCPHVYVSCWTNIDSNEDDVFLLSPISAETLALAIEDWQIWERWSVAHKNGLVPAETHPCLPDERERHLALQQELQNRLVLDERAIFAATAIFQFKPTLGEDPGRMIAEWTVVPYDHSKDKRAKYEWSPEDEDDNGPNNPMNPSGGSGIA